MRIKQTGNNTPVLPEPCLPRRTEAGTVNTLIPGKFSPADLTQPTGAEEICLEGCLLPHFHLVISTSNVVFVSPVYIVL